MANRTELDSVRLDETAARRLLERATELDARLASESTVADLREAARAAGISEEAFNRALIEVREAPVAVPGRSPRFSARRKMALVLLAAVLAGVGLALTRTRAAAPMPEPAAQAAPDVPTPGARMPVVPPPSYHQPVPKRPR